MNSAFWFLCLLGFALINQGHCRPNPEEEYPQDGEVEDYDGDEDDLNEDEGPPPVIKSSPLIQEVNVGATVVFPCDVEGNEDLFSRVWRKDGKGLYVGSVPQTTNPRITQLQNGSLEIRQIDAADSGSYSCLISLTKPQEVIHTLRVRSPAQITKISPHEKVVNLKQYNSLTLECIANGYPTPSIKWFRNGHVLEAQDTPSIHGARYTIDNASLEDAGIYKCTATNGQQKPDEQNIEVQVHYPPVIKIARDTVPTGEGYESQLKCTVAGIKKPEVKWYKDQKHVAPSQRIKFEKSGHDHILKILKTQASDFGDYMCEAKNAEGQSTAVIRLTGNPSRPILESSVPDGVNKNPTLVFNVESFAPIEEYELLYKTENSDEWIYVKPPVTPATEGRFFTVKYTLPNVDPGVYVAQIKARNVNGWSEFSSVQTFPKEHEGDLTETGLLAISETSSSAELRISVALLVSLLVAHFYC